MLLNISLQEEFVAVTQNRVRFNEPMRTHTTFHIGGPADIWTEPRTAEELRQLLTIARDAHLEVMVIGGGANLLILDGGIPGLVIHIGHPNFQKYEPQQGQVLVGAGLPLEWLIRRSQDKGLSGVEFLAGVPGRVGGAVRMNAGTHDDEGKLHSFSDIVSSVTIMNLSGSVEKRTLQEIGFGYRKSQLQNQIVLDALLNMLPDDPGAIQDRVKRLWEFKRRTQDWTAPSAGCIFKNPAGAPPAGFLIDKVGLKGYSVGAAAVSSVHGNFMVNRGEAAAADVVHLIDEARARVRKTFGVELELEVQILGRAK